MINAFSLHLSYDHHHHGDDIGGLNILIYKYKSTNRKKAQMFFIL